MTGFQITWTDGTVQSVGVFSNGGGCSHTTENLIFNVEDGEIITSIQMQGNSGVLCNFAIKTTYQSVNLGDTSCGGNNDATTDVGSGIIGGFFGYASTSTIYQLGLIMLQDITGVSQSTASFNSFPSTPSNTNIGSQYVDATGSSDQGTGILTYQQQTGYSSTVTKASTTTLSSTTTVFGSYSYAETTPVQSSSVTVGANETFQFTQSTSVSSSQTTDTTSTFTASYNLCCPPQYYCTWSVYQGQGEISSTDPAQTTLGSTVTFKTGSTTSYNTSSPWYGSSSSSQITLVLTTDPPPANGSSIDDVTNYCNTGKRRRSLNASSSGKYKAIDLDFGAVYKNPKANQLRYVESRLAKIGVNKKNLYTHNPYLWKLKPTSIIPKGKKLKYRVKQKGFMMKFKGKA